MTLELLDRINASFEFIGAYFAWHNAYQLYKDKQVRGVFWGTWVFFTIWGGWNLIYYSGLDQDFSFWGGLILLIGNIVWVSLAYNYRKN